MNKSKTFNVTVKKTREFEASVASMFVLSNGAYKGNFEFISDLQNIVAHNGDYADVFETNSRWIHENNQWVNTDKEILINPLLDVKIDILQQIVTSIQQELGNIGELLDELNGEVI